MTANFFDLSGVMVGCDFHVWVSMPVPAPPAPVPIPFTPHIVGSQFLTVKAKVWHIIPSVTTGHFPVMHGSWGLLLVGHAPPAPPPPPPPHLTEPVNLGVIIATSSSNPILSAHSVTAKGDSLAVCMLGSDALNLDCGTIPSPTGKVWNMNSVMTTPTAGDWASGLLAAAINSAFGAALSFLGGSFGSAGGVKNFFGSASAKTGEAIIKAIGEKAATVAVPIAIAAVQAAADLAKRLGIPYAPWADPVGRGAEKAGEGAQKGVDGEK